MSAIFVDLSKAFDAIHNNLLLAKLRAEEQKTKSSSQQ